MKFRKSYILVVIVVFIFFSAFFLILPRPLFKDPICIVLEDRNGTLLGAHIASDGQWRFPENFSVPEKFKNCILAFEDKRFNIHQGFDPLAILRAFTQNIKAAKTVSGGSTLTMQVIRLARKGRARTFSEKIVELVLATSLEATYSKSEILGLYSSHAPFGRNIVGLDAASWIYFGRSSEKLSWAETAMLAVLPNSPALIHPGKNRDILKNKRNRLLKKLLDAGIIDISTYELSVMEPLPEKPLALPRFSPHLLGRIYNDALRQERSNAVFKTTLDLNLQRNVTYILNNYHLSQFSGNGIHNAAAIVLDVKKNEVLAYVGNIGNMTDFRYGGNVDIITAERSTGSILKPFLYAAMLSSGDILPNALVPDVPTKISGYSPKNFNLGYDGCVPAKRAIARSLNIPSVKMLQSFGINRFLSVLKKIGITTARKSAGHYGLSLILGGCEGTLWEVVGAYASMARSLNNFTQHSSRYSSLDYSMPDFLVTENKKKSLSLEKSSVLSASALWFTFNAMIDADRPTDDSNWQYFSSSRRIAWKTGTSFGFRDGWAIGVTPTHVVGVWVGNANGEGRPELTGINCAAPVMFDIFNLLPQTSRWFDQPYDDMFYGAVCRKSGHLLSENCEAADSVWLPKQGIHFQKCPYHKLLHLDATSTWRVHSNCEDPQNMQHKAWFILPPVMEYYYRQKNFDYVVVPEYRDDCLKSLLYSSARPMEVIYPKDLAQIYVPLEIDGSRGSVVFEAAHRTQGILIFWYVDNIYAGCTSGFHHIAVQPKNGKHILTLVDQNGERLEQPFEIIDKEVKDKP